MTEETNASAYDLLSRPTLSLSDAEVEIVVADLRRRRAAFIATGKPDKVAKPKAATVSPSAESKAANTAALLSMLKLNKD